LIPLKVLEKSSCFAINVKLFISKKLQTPLLSLCGNNPFEMKMEGSFLDQEVIGFVENLELI
jgi:hypothetical protein